MQGYRLSGWPRLMAQPLKNLQQRFSAGARGFVVVLRLDQPRQQHLAQQAAPCNRCCPQNDVSATARHIGGDGDGTGTARLGHNF